MKVCRSGTTVCPRDSARTSSRLGSTSTSDVSAATIIQLLEGVGEAEPARRQQHTDVVEHVGRLRAYALVGIATGGGGQLAGLLPHLLADPRRIGQQLNRVAAVGARRAPFGDRALEGGQRLVRGRLELAAEEAGPLARVAGRSGGLDERKQGVRVAVVAQLAQALDVARCLALAPELLARAAEEVHLPGLARVTQGLLIHVGHGQNLARPPVLHDARDEATLVVGDLVQEQGILWTRNTAPRVGVLSVKQP